MNPEEAPKEESPLKQIRTFQGDVADAIKNQKASIFSIQQTEKAKREALGQLSPSLQRELGVKEGNKKVLLLILGTLVLLALGGAGAWYSYKSYLTKTATPVISIPANRFISSDSELNVDVSTLSRDNLINIVRQEWQKNFNLGATEHIELKKGAAATADLLPTSSFLVLIGARPSNSLVRAFDPLFMLGVLGGTPNNTFLIIKLGSFDSAFPGMLDWEKNMRDDLLPFFASEEELKNVPASDTFQDITIRNKDARVLRDSAGQSVMIYSFFDNQTLVMANNESSLQTLTTRLTSEKLVR